MKKSNPIALLPIGVFLVIYLGLGLLFKYGLKINMGFYNIPHRRGVSHRPAGGLPAEPRALL